MLGGDHLSKSESWKTWIIVAALLIFAGLASAVIPFLADQLGGAQETESTVERHPAVTTIDVTQLPFIGEVLIDIPIIAENIQGLPISMTQAFAIGFGVVLISVGGLGLLIAVIALIFSKWVNNVYADENYQAAEAELSKRQQTLLKQRQESQPPIEPVPATTRARGTTLVFGFLIVLLVWVTTVLLGYGLYGDETISIGSLQLSAVAGLSLIAVILTIVILYLLFRRRDPLTLNNPESDYKPVNWGTIWVIVTGLLVVGIGTGLAIALTSTG